MHVLFFVDNFPPETNAPASRVYERACYWVNWGHQVTVMTTAPNFPVGKLFPGYKNRWYQVEQMNGIRVVRVKTLIHPNKGVVLRTLDFLSFMVMAFICGLFQPRPDVVASTSPQFFCAVAAWAVAKLRRIPYVFELGDLWPKQIISVGVIKENFALRCIEKFELFLYRQAVSVVALTSAFKDDLTRRGIDPGKIQIIINGVDLSRYKPRVRDEALAADLGLEDKFVVGYLGTHGLSQDLNNVLDTAERLRGREDIRFLFVGAGAARDGLIQDAQRRGLTNILFVPNQPKAEVLRYWSLCSVALIHLKDEPLFTTVIPSKAFEAMAMRLPLLVVAPQGEITAIVERERAGVCVPPGDPQAFAAAVAGLANDPKLCAAYAQASRAAAPRYTRERQARDFLSVLVSASSRVETARAHAATAD